MAKTARASADPALLRRELDLLSLCAERDEAAWREFLSRYKTLIYGAALKVLKARGAVHLGLEEDVFQEVIAKLLADDARALRSFAGRSKVTTWLTRITINKTIDLLRTKRVMPIERPERGERPDGTPEADPLDVIPVDEDLPAALADKDLLERALDRLKDEERLVLRLYFLEGLKEREIAALVGEGLNTVSSRKSRSLQKLHRIAADLEKERGA